MKLDITLSNPNLKEDLNDGTGRSSKKQCVLPEQIKTALYKINPNIPKENIDSVIRDLCRDFTGTDMIKTNYDNYNLIRNGKKVDFKKTVNLLSRNLEKATVTQG